MQTDYEIHYIKRGHKNVRRIRAKHMMEVDAWKVAIIAEGGSREETLPLVCLAQVKALAARYDVSSVRWNKAIHVKNLETVMSNRGITREDTGERTLDPLAQPQDNVTPDQSD